MVGGTDQRILLRQIGEAGHLGPGAQQLGPPHGLIDDGEGVAVAVLGRAERLDHVVEQPHQAADIARRGGVGLLLGMLAPREGATDQPGFQVEQHGDQSRAPPMGGVAAKQIGG